MSKSEVKLRDDSQRRKLLKSIVAGGGIAGTAAVSTWTRPVVDTVLLPAHAQLSALSRYTFVGSGPPLTSVVNQDGLQLYTKSTNETWLDAFIPSAHADDSLNLWQYLLIEVSPGNFKLKVLAEGVSETCKISFLFIYNGLAIGTRPIEPVVRFCGGGGPPRGEGPRARLFSYGPEFADITLAGFPIQLIFNPNPADFNLTDCSDCFPEVEDV